MFVSSQYGSGYQIASDDSPASLIQEVSVVPPLGYGFTTPLGFSGDNFDGNYYYFPFQNIAETEFVILAYKADFSSAFYVHDSTELFHIFANPAGRMIGFAFDGNRMYVTTGAGGFWWFLGGPTMSEVNAGPSMTDYSGIPGYYPILFWDGADYILRFPCCPALAGPTSISNFDLFVIDTQVQNTFPYTQYNAGAETGLAVWSSGGNLYRAVIDTVSGNLVLGVCAAYLFLAPFVYTASDVPSGIIVGGNAVLPGMPRNQDELWYSNANASNSLTKAIISGATFASKSTVANGTANYSSTAISFGFPVVPVGYILDANLNPITGTIVIDPIAQVAGFPSTPILMFAACNVNTAHLYIKPVIDSGEIAQYIQVATAPIGPWLSEIDLGAELAGSETPFWIRGYPPSTELIGSYPFSLYVGTVA